MLKKTLISDTKMHFLNGKQKEMNSIHFRKKKSLLQMRLL